MNTNPKLKTRLSRREKLKRSPVPWIIMLVISLLIFFVFIFGDISVWNAKRNNIERFETENQKLEKTLDELGDTVKDLKNQFEKKAEAQEKKESQIFPEELDLRKLVQVLEIFSLQMFNIGERNQRSEFILESLSVSPPSIDQEQDGSRKVTATMSITTDQENLETFIEYLQTNDIPERMLEAQQRGRLDEWDFKIIEGYTLPIMLIDSITKSEADDGVIKASLNCSFYFQPPSNESN